jgi:hypothetical protein
MFMRIDTTRYIIVRKGFPITFFDENYEDTDMIEYAVKYYTKENAEEDLKHFDEPKEYQIIELTTTYEF